MDIPVKPFTKCHSTYDASTLTSITSEEAESTNNILTVGLRVCLNVPATGSINIEFQTMDDGSAQTSQWPVDLGFGAGSDSEKKLDCRVTIDKHDGSTHGALLQEENCEGPVGVKYASCKHPKLRCMLFTGWKTGYQRGTDPPFTTPNNTVIQIRGFFENITKGQQVEIIIPGITVCDTSIAKYKCEITI